jgi:Asp/Glu/hydantoin racemase
MGKKLAIIHTTPVTVEPLKQLAAEKMPDAGVVNFVDDSILPQLAANGGDLGEVRERLFTYAKFAEQAGADVILNACSSVGELVAGMREQVKIPVVRIDEAMAERAVQLGTRIGVAATLKTTLNPTMNLLQAKAQEAGKAVELIPLLAEEAYKKLIAGDKEGHDETLAAALERLLAEADFVVLAQASMARVIGRLPEPMRERVLTSPELGMKRVREVLAGV